MAKEDEILSWAGKTADVFAEEFADAPKKLRKLKKSYDLAGDALTSFWPDLEAAQDKADKALRDGRKARAELSTAQTALSGANDWVRTATEKTGLVRPVEERRQGRPEAGRGRGPPGHPQRATRQGPPGRRTRESAWAKARATSRSR